MEKEIATENMTAEEKEIFRKGYLKGYSDKTSAIRKAKREAASEYNKKLTEIDICALWPFNLIEELVEDTSIEAPNIIYSVELFNKVLNTLTEREKRCLELYYRDRLTLDQIGSKFNVTRERARQILANATRHIGQRSKLKAMIAVSKVDYDELAFRYKQLERENEVLKSVCPVDALKDPDPEDMNLIMLEDLDLSIRSYNALKRAGIQTLGELVTLTPEKLQKVKNMGRKSIAEINIKLRDLGLGLKQNI